MRKLGGWSRMEVRFSPTKVINRSQAGFPAAPETSGRTQDVARRKCCMPGKPERGRDRDFRSVRFAETHHAALAREEKSLGQARRARGAAPQGLELQGGKTEITPRVSEAHDGLHGGQPRIH